MSFVRVGRGLINLDHVKSIYPTRKADSEGVTVNYADGSDAFFNDDEIEDYLEKFTAPVIAAHARYEAALQQRKT